MKKEDIILKLHELNLDNNEYWVIAGAAMVLHGLREETTDIDLGCSKKMFNSLISFGYYLDKNELGYRRISLNEEIEFFEDWNVSNIDYIEGIPTASLQSIREMKIQMGREKDIKDIMLIDLELGKSDS